MALHTQIPGILASAGGTYFSRRVIRHWNEPGREHLEHLLEAARSGELESNNSQLRRFMAQITDTEESSLVILEEDKKQGLIDEIIDFVQDGKITSEEIYKIHRILEANNIHGEVMDRLDAINGHSITPLTPNEAWNKQDLSDNCAPALVSVVSNQHGIYTDEATFSVRSYIMEIFGHDPDCEVNLLTDKVTCDPDSSEVGTLINRAHKLFELNNLPVHVRETSSLRVLDAELAAGHSVVIAVDARPLWSEIFIRVPEQGEPLGHIIQVIRETPDGKGYVCNDTGHGMGREVVYSKEAIKTGWERGGVLIATDNRPPESTPEQSTDARASIDWNAWNPALENGHVQLPPIDDAIQVAAITEFGEITDPIVEVELSPEAMAAKLMYHEDHGIPLVEASEDLIDYRSVDTPFGVLEADTNSEDFYDG